MQISLLGQVGCNTKKEAETEKRAMKKAYHGIQVAVKEFLPRSLPEDVRNEANLLA